MARDFGSLNSQSTVRYPQWKPNFAVPKISHGIAEPLEGLLVDVCQRKITAAVNTVVCARLGSVDDELLQR